MTGRSVQTETRILDAAERLFMLRGLASVKLEHIASAVNMRHASLYYYAPRGKQQLYVAVMLRCLQRHHDGISRAIDTAAVNLLDQMRAVATWFATQPPLDLTRILHSDLSELDAKDARAVDEMILSALRTPIAAAVSAAAGRGELRIHDADFAAMSLVALLQSMHNIPKRFAPTEAARIAIATQMADDLLLGWMKR